MGRRSEVLVSTTCGSGWVILISDKQVTQVEARDACGPRETIMLQDIVVGLTHLRLRTKVLLIISSLLAIGVAMTAWTSLAATPSSGTLSEGNPVLNYDAGPFNTANQSPLGLGQLDQGPRCNDTTFPCDSYA